MNSRTSQVNHRFSLRPWLNHTRFFVQFGWWVLFLLLLALFAASAPVRYDELMSVAPAGVASLPGHLRFVLAVDAPQIPLQLAQASVDALQALNLSLQFYALAVTGFEVLVVLAGFAIAALLAWRRGADRMALFSAWIFLLSPLFFMPTVTALARADPAWNWLIRLIWFLEANSAIAFWFLFPDGRFVPRWTRLVTLGVWGWNLSIRFWPALNPFSWPPLSLWLYFLGYFGLIAWAQLYRYRHVATSVQRQQTKWLVFGVILIFLAFLVLNFDLPGLFVPALHQSGGAILLYNLASLLLYGAVFILFPMLTAIAVLRYRLFAIDWIIRRTLIYSVLTATLALVYFAGVVLVQALFTFFTPATSLRDAPWLTVLSTLVIAALFTPLRQFVQEWIDRRFYRRKYDAEQALASFGAIARNEVNLDRLRAALLAAVQETVQPAQVSLWLEPARKR